MQENKKKNIAYFTFSYKFFSLSIESLKFRGMEFLDIPDTYYTELRKRLKLSKVNK